MKISLAQLNKAIVVLLLVPFICSGALVSYWKLEGNSNDSVGSNNGTDTSVSYAGGFRGQSASLGTGGSSYINFGNSTTLEPVTNDYFTVGGCFYKASWSDGDLFHRNSATALINWDIAVYLSEICLLYFPGSDQAYCIDVDMTDAKWNCVAFTYRMGTGSSIKGWKDGKLYTGSWVLGNGNAAWSTAALSTYANKVTYVGYQSNYKADELFYEERTYTDAEIKTKYQNLRGDF